MYRPVAPALLLLSIAASAVVVGCDDQSPDRKVQREVARSHMLALGGTDQSLAEARQILESASTDAAASLATQINAKALLAQIELEASRVSQREMQRRMMHVSRLVSEITQLGQQIATTNALIAGYKRYDPQQALAGIQQQITDARGGPDRATWFTHENAQIPTLAVLKQDIARLEGDIAEQEQQLNQLQSKRADVLREADNAARAAEGPKTVEAFEAFRRAADLRKQATDLATEIEIVESSLLPLRNDLQVARAQERVISALIVDLQQKAEALQRAWQQIQQQIRAQSDLATAILQGAAGSAAATTVVPAGGSISNKASELAAIVAELASLRQKAMDDARSASENYAQAVSKAMELRQQLSSKIQDPRNQSRPEQNSWKTMRDVLDPGVFRLQQASAQRTLASILAISAQELGMRAELLEGLSPILLAANLPIPDQLHLSNAQSERADLIRQANEAFELAAGLLESITDGQAQRDVQNAAYVSRALTLYAWSELNREAGDAKAAAEHLQLARQVINLAIERDITLPALPAGLSVAVHKEPGPNESPAPHPATAPDQPAPDAAAPAAAPQPAAPESPAPGN